jgi:hypothetical protein
MVVDWKPIPFRVHMVVFPFPTQACIRLVIILSKSLVVEYNIAFTFMNTTPEPNNTRHGFKGKDKRFQDHCNNIHLNIVDMQPMEYGVSTILNFQILQRVANNLQDTCKANEGTNGFVNVQWYQFVILLLFQILIIISALLYASSPTCG